MSPRALTEQLACATLFPQWLIWKLGGSGDGIETLLVGLLTIISMSPTLLLCPPSSSFAGSDAPGRLTLDQAAHSDFPGASYKAFPVWALLSGL